MTHAPPALRLVDAAPLDRARAHARSAARRSRRRPSTVTELAGRPTKDEARVEAALHLLGERYSEGRSGIVLEQVAGGFAFRAARAEAEACARLVERPVERGLSQAALETLAIVAYLGPCTRPEIARLRGVAADTVSPGSSSAALSPRPVERPGSAARSATGRPSCSSACSASRSCPSFPASTISATDADEIRERLDAVAERRPA